MNQKEIRERVELALQDVENRRWTDTEINQYIDDALVEFTRLAKHPQKEGLATNQSGGTSIGEAKKAGTLTIDGKTATITFASSHGYKDDDVLHIFIPSHIVTTVNTSTNVLSSVDEHGLVVDDAISFSSTDTLPAGLSNSTFYVLTVPTKTTFTVGTAKVSEGGTTVDITDAGSGFLKTVVSRTQPAEYLGSFNIKKKSNTAITYTVKNGSKVTTSPISVFRMGPVFNIPSTIAEITSVSIDGRELAIYTESELNAAASTKSGRHFMLESSMGFHPNPFSFIASTVENTPRWREQTGPIEAVIFNNRTATSFRIYPLPKENRDLYVDEDATDLAFQTLTVRGVPKVSSLTTNTSTPEINSYWHEAIVFGALERALSKESQVQNIEKGQMYRAKFVEQAAQAQKMEGITSGSLSEGRNQGGFTINRNL